MQGPIDTLVIPDRDLCVEPAAAEGHEDPEEALCWERQAGIRVLREGLQIYFVPVILVVAYTLIFRGGGKQKREELFNQSNLKCSFFQQEKSLLEDYAQKPLPAEPILR